MNRKRLLAMLLTLSLTSTVLLVGCNNDSKKPEADKSSTETPVNAPETKMDKEQYVNLALTSEAKTLDACIATDVNSSTVLGNCMEALTRCEQTEEGTDEIKAAGAEKWEMSEDGLTWTFHLRDFNWSDGQPVKAADFEYAIKRSLDPKTASQYAFILYPIKNAKEYNTQKAKAEDVGVKAIDDTTLEFKLDKPCPYFLDLTYFKVMMPQRKDIVEKHGEKYGTESNTLIFNGPFILKNWVHDSKMEFEKNPNYWDKDNVKLDKFTLLILKDQGARMNSLYNGAIDSAGVMKKEWIEKFDKTEKFNVIKGNTPETGYAFFNHNNKYFKNAKIRKAFNIAVDREDRVKVISKDLATPAYGFAPFSLQINGQEFREKAGEQPIQRLKNENPDPKKLLLEGLKEIGEPEDLSKVKISMLVAGVDARAKEQAEFDQQMYKKNLGISLKVEYREWPIFQKDTAEMKFDFASQYWAGDYNDPNTFFDMWMTGAGVCETGWTNKKYDDLISKANSTLDPEERFKCFKEAEDILLYEDAAIMPYEYGMRNTYRCKYVKRMMSPMFGTADLKYCYTEGR